MILQFLAITITLFMPMVAGCALKPTVPAKAAALHRAPGHDVDADTHNIATAKFLLPTINERNVIYVMIAMNEADGTSPYDLAPEAKIDLREVLKAHGMRGNHLNERDLFTLLLATETKIRLYMREHRNFMRAVIYVGKSKNLVSRARSHRADILDTIKRYQSSKVRWLNAVLKKRYVRMEYLVKNIPTAQLDIFESLVGHLFSVLDFKGSSQIGTTAAYETLIKYFHSSQRIEELKKLGVINSMETDRERLRELILPFNAPWSSRWMFFHEAHQQLM